MGLINISDVKGLTENFSLTPDQIPGVQLWADFTDLLQITSNSSNNIAQVSDKSGIGNHLVQASSNKPTLKFDGGNGYSCANVSSNQCLSKTVTYAHPFTMYIYMKLNVENGQLVFEFNSAYNTGALSFITTGSNILVIAAGSNFYFNDKRMKLTIGKWTLVRFTITSTGAAYCCLDSNAIVGADSRFSTGIAGANGITKLSIGSPDFSGTWNFDVQEVVVTNTSVSNSDDIKIRNYFFNKYKTVLPNVYYALGDSVTAGRDATSVGTNDFVTLVGAGLSAYAYNYGTAGANIGYPPTIGGANTNLNALYTTVDTRNLNAYITFEYGLNDTTSSNWAAMYKSMVQWFIDKGYNKNRLCVVSTTYDPGRPQDITTNTYLSAMASALGVRYADVYTPLQSHGGEVEHPDDAGHAIMATTILAAFA